MAYLRRCLASLYADKRGPAAEVVVVDNASFDGCGEMIEREFPAAIFIQADRNLGFGRANNLGFSRSKGKRILFLNPDTEVVGPAIERMVQFLDSTPQAGVVGARLLNSDHSIQTSCIQRYPTIVNQVLDANFLRERFRNWSAWGMRPLFESTDKPVPVEVISGACQMIRREVFEQVGFYDGGYFMYAEDADLCFKVQHAGFTNYYVGDAVVLHHGGKSTGATPGTQRSAVIMRESLARFFQKHHGKVSAGLYRTVMGVVSVCRVGSLALLMVITLGRFRRESLRAALAKWSRVLRWAIGLETWSKVVTP